MAGSTGESAGASATPPDIWARFDVSVLSSGTALPSSEKSPASPPTITKRARWWLLHTVSFATWTWIILKVFIGDVDRWLVEVLAPSMHWLLDYRFFGLLAVLAILSVIVKPKSWWTPLFVASWPLALVIFYLPRFMYKAKSAAISVGIIHACFGFVRGLRFTLVSVALVAFALMGISGSDTPWVLIFCVCVLLGVWLVSLVKTLVYSVSPGRFVSSQMRLWRKLYNSNLFWQFVDVDDALRSPEIEKFSQQQASTLVTSLSFGLASTRLGQLWATQLESYRRSPATILAGCLAVVGLFLQGVLTFTFVNVAIFKIDAGEFISAYPPSLATFSYYTFAAASSGEISALVPRGSWASIVSIATGFFTGVIVLMLIVALVLGFRQSKADEATTRSIERLRREADSFENRLGVEYGLGPEALFARLDEAGGGLLRLMPFLLAGGAGRHRRHEEEE